MIILEITELRIDDRFDTPTFCVVSQARSMLQAQTEAVSDSLLVQALYAEAETYYQRMEGRSRPGEQV